jgi:predicted RNase H-like nuclease (RuvC/YqgF family)
VFHNGVQEDPISECGYHREMRERAQQNGLMRNVEITRLNAAVENLKACNSNYVKRGSKENNELREQIARLQAENAELRSRLGEHQKEGGGDAVKD